MGQVGERHRNPDQQLAERASIAHWLAQGKEQWEIRQLLAQQGVVRSPNIISRDVKAIRLSWLDGIQRNLEEWVGEKLAELYAIKREAWDAWHASKGKQERSVRGQSTRDGQPDTLHATIHEFTSPGHPEYLKIVQWCIDQEAKLLGLHKPLQIEWFVHAEAEKIAHDLGLDTAEVLREADDILRGR